MSYDIRLTDPVTGETLELPCEHVMTGGTYQAEYDEATGTFRPAPTREAWLNVTYNYGRYYREAAGGDPRFAVETTYADGRREIEYGIRGLYGKSGAESVQMLEDMIKRIETRYKPYGKWISTTREETRYMDADGNEVDRRYARTHADACRAETYVVEVDEGPDGDYWKDTAANAISPLHKLLAMARLRPDGVWAGD